MTYRIRKFGLTEFVDFSIVSSFVHFRKPDADIFCIALDIAQTPAEQVAYIEDRPIFVDVARSLGIEGISGTRITSPHVSLWQDLDFRLENQQEPYYGQSRV